MEAYWFRRAFVAGGRGLTSCGLCLEKLHVALFQDDQYYIT